MLGVELVEMKGSELVAFGGRWTGVVVSAGSTFKQTRGSVASCSLSTVC